MGQDIGKTHFTSRDFEVFATRLREETVQLADWLRSAPPIAIAHRAGFELEAWLVDQDCRPAPINDVFLVGMDESFVVAELASFNIELNTTPGALRGRALRDMQAELQRTCDACRQRGRELGVDLALAGILPTVRQEECVLENMSRVARYRALNDQILELRRGRPVELDIRGRDHLRTSYGGVMLESAATSFQIHLKVAPHEAARFFNASKILAGPLVAASANSPFLFGRDLWAETRVPLFEQAVSVGASDLTKRVSFGIRYARESILECFLANLERYPVLLPEVTATPLEAYHHLRLHNGTIWRWIRPLVGFDHDGKPHIRIEFRVIPAGPSLADCFANAALYFGLVKILVANRLPPESRLPFDVARRNFYEAARHGLDARLTWLDGETLPAGELLARQLLPLAYKGLDDLGIAPQDRDHFLGIILERVKAGRNGASWQREFVARHGRDMGGLTRAYLDRQKDGDPVHLWPL